MSENLNVGPMEAIRSLVEEWEAENMNEANEDVFDARDMCINQLTIALRAGGGAIPPEITEAEKLRRGVSVGHAECRPDAIVWQKEAQAKLAGAIPPAPEQGCEHEWVTHLIQMPEGYGKPGATKCTKCGALQAPTQYSVLHSEAAPVSAGSSAWTPIENALGLHRTLEVYYVVDGYRAELIDDEGFTRHGATRPTVREAIDALVAALPAPPVSPASEPKIGESLGLSGHIHGGVKRESQ